MPGLSGWLVYMKNVGEMTLMENKDNTTVIAVDLGATSGRVIAVTWNSNDEKIDLQEICRFENRTPQIGERIYTDILHLYTEILHGLRQARRTVGPMASLGIDTWGVDVAFLDREGEVMGMPYFYRDQQTAGMPELADEHFHEGGLFRLTGVQDMWYNTVYQLMGIRERKPDFFRGCPEMMTLSDMLAYLLTGEKNLEYTIVSTTQLYSLEKKAWVREIFEALGLDSIVLPPVIMTGQTKGQVRMDLNIQKEPLPLIATAQHDTASAACAVPAEEEDYIFINSGTWSIIGKVQDTPVITEEVYRKGFSNEGAAFGKVKLVKSIMGMWLVEELRREWKQRGLNTDYTFLQSEAETCPPFACMIDVDDALFVAPRSMEEAIREYCARTGQHAPNSQGAFYRAVLESLAFQYRYAVEELEALTGKGMDTIYFLGGTVRNKMFCQMIADATGRKVSAGPIEATAAGNGFIQLCALGVIRDRQQAAQIIRNSFPIAIWQPKDAMTWMEEYSRYRKVITSFGDV